MGRPARNAARKGKGKVEESDEEPLDQMEEGGSGTSSEEEVVAVGRKRKAAPQKRQVAPQKQPRKAATASKKQIVEVEVEEDSCDSDYKMPEDEIEEDSDSVHEEGSDEAGSSDDEPISPKAKPPRKKAPKKKPVKKVARKPAAKGRKKAAPLNPHNLDEDGDYNVWGGDSDGEVVDPDKLTTRSGPQAKLEPPAEMLMPLLPFQKEWLAWAVEQERGSVKGGILADEMGMGKTIQAISLIVTARSLKTPPLPPLHSAASVSRAGQAAKQACSHQAPSSSAGSSTSAPPLPKVKATLVVCPLVAVIQWRSEIARFTAPGSVKVLVYHGPKRNIDFDVLSQYDIVLTTYSIVESEHRKNVMPDKEECQWCGKKLYPDRLKVHLRFFCGPDAVKSDKLALQQKKRPRNFKKSFKGKATTEEEPFEFEDDPKAKLKGKGKAKATPTATAHKSRKGKQPAKDSDPEEDSEPEEVEQQPSTSGKGKAFGRGRRGVRFGRVSSTNLATALDAAIDKVDEGPAVNSEKSGFSALHSVEWARIVLDEAHSIKDRRCSTAKAVFAIKSEFKWALSGTPLQNRVGELYSLVRFLRMDPYAYYFCKKCDCKSLDYRFGKDWRKCDDCGHSPLHHFCWWNKYVANPIKKFGYGGEGRKAMLRLKSKILDSALLRRTKVERAADLALPPRCTLLRKDAFDAREQDFYEALYTQSQSQFATYVDSGTVLNNYAHIFDLLIRLRQAVDHPYLVVHSATAPPTSAVDPKTGEAPETDVCGLCHDPVEDSVVTACKHSFCRTCLVEYVAGAGGDAETAKGAGCPTCQKPLTVDLTGSAQAAAVATAASIRKKRTSILNRINLGGFQTSTKIEALREEIALMSEDDPSAKGLVFSQFTSMLDLCHFRLEKAGIKCVKLDGSMSMEHRDRMIQDFTNDPDVKVFLMSLKAGGVALNLTVASRVFLMDPWWNPAVEQQAQDRIHRLGQYKPIQVTRFVIENTIEERILKLQEKKQLVFDGTVGGSAEALGRLTAEDLAFLFSS